MKKVCVSLAVAILLTGCMSTKSNNSSKLEATATNVSAISQSKNLIADPQLTKFRMSSGGQSVWKKEVVNKAGSGSVSSSKDSAFDKPGSARIRFNSKDDDFSAQPGLSQTVKGLDTNTDYELSLYYSDKRRQNSPTELLLEVQDLNGETIGRKTIHIDDLANARRGQLKTHFRQAFVTFNSGKNMNIKVIAKLKVSSSDIDLDDDISKQTEIRVDEFVLIKD